MASIWWSRWTSSSHPNCSSFARALFVTYVTEIECPPLALEQIQQLVADALRVNLFPLQCFGISKPKVTRILHGNCWFTCQRQEDHLQSVEPCSNGQSFKQHRFRRRSSNRRVVSHLWLALWLLMTWVHRKAAVLTMKPTSSSSF